MYSVWSFATNKLFWRFEKWNPDREPFMISHINEIFALAVSIQPANNEKI